MPFLRSDLGAEVELRSSKSLIGRAASKCDVVLDGDGMLDLHALLTLAEDKASATLMPFATTGNGGMCFVNDQVVRQDGETVVHGDRVAFGDKRNAFVFELTSPSGASVAQSRRSVSTPVVNAAGNSSVRFRRALDALRGDQSAAVPTRNRTPLAASRAARASSSRSSNDQLGQFLKEASADSLLSDYVERKLQQSRSNSSLRKSQQQRNRPTAMEPPPSLSASSTSSSLLSDSILNHSAPAQVEDTQTMLSTAERNYAEVEKLQLSQRLREVNNVLNGHLAFCSSYLSKGDDEELQSNLDTQKSTAAVESKDDESLEEEEEDDLPVMVEKKKPIRSPLRPAVQPIPVPTPEPEEDENQDEHLLDSLPGFSEPIRAALAMPEADKTHESIATLTTALVANAVTASTNDNKVLLGKIPRTRLHQQLIDQRIRYKRQEVLSHAFVRWRRGLRMQHQNRVVRGQQLQKARLRLVICRRDNCFSRWKAVAQVMNQVISCRVDAFQQRVASRSLRRVLSEWRIQCLCLRRRSESLGFVLRSQRKKRMQQAFARWQMNMAVKFHKQTLVKRLDEQQRSVDRYKERLSDLQQARRGVRSHLALVLRHWKQHTQKQRKRCECIRKLIKWGFLSKQKRMAWVKWKEVAMLTKHTSLLHTQYDDRLKAAVEEQRQIHDRVKAEAQAHHTKETQSLREQAEEANTRVHQLQQSREKMEQQKVKRKHQWNDNLERFFKAAVVRYNKQIGRVNQELELLIQQSEHDMESTRYQAASFLVEAVLEQKVHNSNVCMETQEALMQAFQRHMQHIHTDLLDNDDSTLKSQQFTDNTKFLYDMLQQRLTRLHQLHEALAKLASAQNDQTIDTKKLRHAQFLANAIRDRESRHLDDMQRMYRMQSRFQIEDAAKAAPGAA